MIITDIKGGKLKLLKHTLTEVTGEAVPGFKWTVDLASLKYPHATAFGTKMVWLYREEGGAIGEALYYPERYCIGCRAFTKKTFARILKAVKAVK